MRARAKRRQAERASRKAERSGERAGVRAELARLKGSADRFLRVCGSPGIERGVLVFTRAAARPSAFTLKHAIAVAHIGGDEIALYESSALRRIEAPPGDPLVAALDAADETPKALIVIVGVGDDMSWFRAWVIPKNHGPGGVQGWASAFPCVNAAGGAA